MTDGDLVIYGLGAFGLVVCAVALGQVGLDARLFRRWDERRRRGEAVADPWWLPPGAAVPLAAGFGLMLFANVTDAGPHAWLGWAMTAATAAMLVMVLVLNARRRD